MFHPLSVITTLLSTFYFLFFFFLRLLYSVFRHVTLEQASVRCNSNQFAYNGGALKLARGQPYFYNTKVFFGRNGDSIHVR